jgi:hypothetical protein
VVTVLHQCHGYRVTEAIEAVGNVVGLDPSSLRTCRDNIHRGHHRVARFIYRDFIREVRSLPIADLGGKLRAIREYEHFFVK